MIDYATLDMFQRIANAPKPRCHCGHLGKSHAKDFQAACRYCDCDMLHLDMGECTDNCKVTK